MLNGVVEDGMYAVVGKNFFDDVLFIAVDVKTLYARIWQESYRACEGRSFPDPGFNLWAKELREYTRIGTLGDSFALRIEKSSLSKKSICFLVLPEEASFAGLLHEFGDVTLMDETERQGIVSADWVELRCFDEFGLCGAEISAVKSPRSGEISRLRGLGLPFVEGGGIRLDRFVESGGRRLLGWAYRGRARRGALVSLKYRCLCQCGHGQAEYYEYGDEPAENGTWLEEVRHLLLFRRSSRLTGAGNGLDAWTLTAGWPSHAMANLRGVHIKFSKGSAKGVPVHAEFFGSLALVPLMMREHFEDVALLELTNSIRIRDTGAVHLRDESVQFALQG